MMFVRNLMARIGAKLPTDEGANLVELSLIHI